MIINIFGIQIRTGDDRAIIESPQFSSDNINAWLAEGPCKGMRFYQPLLPEWRARFAKKIHIPLPNKELDVFEIAKYNKVVLDLKECLETRRNFSICPIRDLMEITGIIAPPSSVKYMDFLQTIHCKDYSTLPPNTIQLAFVCVAFILSEGATANPSTYFDAKKGPVVNEDTCPSK